MKQILYLSRGGAVGGSQRQLYYVVTNLTRRPPTLVFDKKTWGETRGQDDGYKPVVACRNDGQFFGRLQACGIKTNVLPFHPWRKFPAGLCRYIDAERLARYAKAHQVSLVHCSDLWLSEYMIWIAKRLKIPSVLHVRTPICPDEVHKHHCNKATAIIAISRRVKQNLLDAGVCPEKITQIDDAVDLDIFHSNGPDENVLRRDFSPVGNVLIGIVGRIQLAKRQLVFLQAAEQIIHNLTRNVTFIVIGNHSCRSYFEQLREFVNKNGLSEHVIFTGNRDDMPEVLSSLDILVSLSGGSVMFEAMACGKVVVSMGFSSEEDSVHIQNGRTGVLVSSTKNSELVEALIHLIDSPELRRQIGREARKWAEKNFCHIAMADKTQQLYRQLLRD